LLAVGFAACLFGAVHLDTSLSVIWLEVEKCGLRLCCLEWVIFTKRKKIAYVNILFYKALFKFET